MDSDHRLIDFWLDGLEKKREEVKYPPIFKLVQDSFFGWVWYFMFLLMLVLPTTGFSQVFLQPGQSTSVSCIENTHPLQDNSCAPCPTPSPATTPAPTPAPVLELPIKFASSIVGSNPFTTPTSDESYKKSYSTIMVQSWYSLPSQSHCNYLRTSPTKVEVCVPYNDFGFTFRNNPFWESVKQHQLPNTYFIYSAKDSSGQWIEAAMDFSNQNWLNTFKNQLVTGFPGYYMPKAGSGHNGMFFDNGYFDPTWVWNTYPINAATRKAQMKAALTSIRDTYTANGDKIVMNVWSDVTATWANDSVYYRSVVTLADYILFERGVVSPNSGSPLTQAEALNYLNKAYDYNKNTSTTVMWNTQYGNFWYNFVAGLFSCTDTKCMFWQEPAMNQINLDKINKLKLGVPVEPWKLSGCYARKFSNGVAVLNLTPSSCTYQLASGTYDNLVNGGTVSGSVTLNGNTGNVFTKKLI